MLFKCLECGAEFEDCDVKRYHEPYGWEYEGCPACGGMFEEAIPCDVCGEYHLPDELTAGQYKVCRSCLEDMAKEHDVIIGYLDDCDLWDDFARYLDGYKCCSPDAKEAG